MAVRSTERHAALNLIRLASVALWTAGMQVNCAFAQDAQPEANDPTPVGNAQHSGREAPPPLEIADSLDSLLDGTLDPQEAPETFNADPAVDESEILPTIPVATAAVAEESLGKPERVIDEIVVTATKRNVSVRDVPISVDVLSGDDLVEKGAINLDEILKRTPGVQNGGGRVTMRGVAASPNVLQASQETGRFLGDVSLSAPSSQGALSDLDPYDMSTVEVLRGPQSTFFGGTALAGAIRYVPNEPDPSAFSMGVRAGYGSVDGADGEQSDLAGMVNVPFGGSFALRAAGTYRYNPNVIVDTERGIKPTDEYRLRATRYMARWMPIDPLTINLTHVDYYFRNEFTFMTDPERFVTDKKRMAEPSITTMKLTSLGATYSFEKFDVVGIASTLTSAQDFTVDSAPVLGTTEITGAVPFYTFTENDSPTYELRLVSTSPSDVAFGFGIFDDWDYLVGLYYMDADQSARATVSYLGVIIADNFYQVHAFETALYSNFSRRLFEEKFDISIGARYAITELETDVENTSQGLQTNGSDSQIVEDTRINPQLGLTWHFSEDVNIRLSYAEGFRFGGLNTIAIPAEMLPTSFKSDSLQNFEVGLRSDWLDRALRFDVTGFRMLWKDLQFKQTSRLAQGYISNVGEATIDGIETQLTVQVPDWGLLPAGLSATFAFSLLDARTTEDFTSENGFVPAGTRLPISSERYLTLGLDWGGAWGTWIASASARGTHASDQKNDMNETYRLPAYTTLDASFRIQNLEWTGAPAISITGTNLTGNVSLYNATPITASQGEHLFVSRGTPRTIKVNLDLSF